ncbi:MAG: gliding motility-associated C-terminal domain-containing protein [Flavobacteriales bacterium]|nr:gliding motility-associated C-terminal domain-containing protein [Flavobacteriales bacterium]
MVYADYTITIFNRNGNLIFESNNYQSDWNGTYQGKKLPATSYYYVLEIPSIDKVYKGALSIIYDD